MKWFFGHLPHMRPNIKAYWKEGDSHRMLRNQNFQNFMSISQSVLWVGGLWPLIQGGFYSNGAFHVPFMSGSFSLLAASVIVAPLYCTRLQIEFSVRRSYNLMLQMITWNFAVLFFELFNNKYLPTRAKIGKYHKWTFFTRNVTVVPSFNYLFTWKICFFTNRRLSIAGRLFLNTLFV